jgi:hypothetical protein
MKKLLIIWVALVLSTGAIAQRHGGFGGHYGGYGYGGGFYGPRVGLSLGLGYPYYPYGPYGYYYPYGAPYYGGNSGGYENKLTLKIEEINNKYDYKKSLVKQDKALSHHQKRMEKKALKYEREQAISQAKEDYYNNKFDKK